MATVRLPSAFDARPGLAAGAALLLCALAGLGGCRSSLGVGSQGGDPIAGGAGSAAARAAGPQVPAAPGAAVPGPESPAAAARDVASLRDPDFGRRSAAAARLVAAGAPALPALGAAGDQPSAGADGRPDSSTAPVVAAILARQPDEELARILSSPHATLRRGAADELGRRTSWAPVPRLIDRLEDPVPDVREAAHAALRRLTHEFLEAPAGGHASAADRWRRWWSQTGRARARAQVPGG